jgi:hypothetical protein
VSGLPFPPSRFIAVAALEVGERHRRFRPDLPTLDELWSAFAPIIDANPRDVTGERVCQLLSSLATNAECVKVGTWCQWCLRARESSAFALTPEPGANCSTGATDCWGANRVN